MVLPDADVKIYLDASLVERARRRGLERGISGHVVGSAEAEQLLDDLRARDEIDSGRATAPLRAAPDAILIRTDGFALEEAVDAVVSAVRGRTGAR